MNITFFVNIFQDLQYLLSYPSNLFLIFICFFKMRRQSRSSIFHEQLNLSCCFFVEQKFDDIRVVQLIEKFNLIGNSFVLFFKSIGGYLLFFDNFESTLFLSVFKELNLTKRLFLGQRLGISNLFSIKNKAVWHSNTGYNSLIHIYNSLVQMKAGKNTELDNLLINLNQNAEPPSYQIAKHYQKKYSLTSEPLTCLGIEQYSKFGPGVKLYFAMLKYMICLYLVLSVAVLPSLVVNYHGNGLSLYGNSWQQTFLKFSLSNQESLDLAHDQLTLQQQIARVKDVKFNQIIVITNDIFCSFIILAFLIFWRIKSKSIVSQIISKNAPPSYHTLLVDLPHHFQQHRLLDHFSQFGAVQQIQYVHNYGNFLLELKEFINVIDSYSQQLNKSKKDHLYDEIEEKYNKLKKFYKSINEQGEGNPFPKIKAFVSFEDYDLAQRVHGIYKYNMKNMNLSMDGVHIKVKKCFVQPLSIIWENFHLKDHNEYLRSCLFIALVAFILLVTLFGIFVLSLHSNGMTKNDENFTINDSLEKNITFLQAQNSNDSVIIYAFCSTLTYKTFQWRYYELCTDYFKRYQKHWIYLGTLSIVVSAVTVILIKIVFAMTQLRRFRTLPEKRRFMIISILITYLATSSLLTLLIRAQIKWQGGSFSLVNWAQDLFPELSVKTNLQVYNQMSRKWYMQIGKILLANYFLTMNLFPWFYVIQQWVLQQGRCLWARAATTQKIMNKRILDSQFYWQFYYSVQLNSTYFCLFFSLAMPILYLLAFFSLVSLFLTSKIIFKYFTKAPQASDHKLSTFIMHAISVSLVLHQFCSLYALSVNQIFPENEPQLVSFTFCKVIYIGLSCILIVVLIYLKRISQLLQNKFWRKRQDLMITQQINSTFGADRQERKIRKSRPVSKKRSHTYLTSYKMEDNPYYNNISYTLLILQQVISNKPVQSFPDFINKIDPERQLSSSLNTPLGSKSLFYGESQSDRNLSF